MKRKPSVEPISIDLAHLCMVQSREEENRGREEGTGEKKKVGEETVERKGEVRRGEEGQQS